MTFHECKQKYGRPLIERRLGGIHKALYADRKQEEVVITYADGNGFYFTLYPPKHLAIDVWRDPVFYAMAEMNGVSNPSRLNPVMSDAA